MPYSICSKKLLARPDLAILCCGLMMSTCCILNAQEIQQTTHNAGLAVDAQDQSTIVRFKQQEAQVGDRVSQQIAMDLSLQGSIIQSGQLAGTQDASMKRGQQRVIDVLEVAEGRVHRAKVTFSHSRQQMPESDEGKETIQPIEGKTYLLTREGERLLVKYVDGTLPPAEEFEIVLGSMQSLGMPNPLAQFLLEKEFRIGETIQMPLALAQQMLGFGSELGEVTKFELKLKDVREVEGTDCAVFDSHIEVGGMPRSPISMQATGPVLIRLDTCRTVLADFSGPLKMSSLHKTSQGSFQQQAEGSLRVAIRSQYMH